MTFRPAPTGALIADRCSPRTSPSTRQRDRASATVELVVLTPVLILLSVLIVFLGRAGQSSGQVRHAADQAARAASQVSVGRMGSTARRVAIDELTSNGTVCGSPGVDTTISFTPSGAPQWVTVTVRCSVDNGGLGLLDVAPLTVRATSTEVVDRYRAP